jgi:protein phosphatase
VRTAFKFLLGLAAVAAVVSGLYVASRQVYFVGTNDAGLVTLYRGVPYDLPFGLKLYEARYASGVPARAIPATRRKRVLDHELRGHGDAVDLVRQLERGRLDTGGVAG